MIIGSGVNRVIGRDPQQYSKPCNLGTEGGATEQGICGALSSSLPPPSSMYLRIPSQPPLRKVHVDMRASSPLWGGEADFGDPSGFPINKMPSSVQGTQESWLEDFVTTGNGDPRNRGTLPRATLVVSGLATHAVRLWPFESWGRAIVISDLCLDPVNFHPVLLFSASFSSIVASCCSPILIWGVGAGEEDSHCRQNQSPRLSALFYEPSSS